VEPRTERFAVAALVWAVVIIVIPLFGTIIALVLAGRAADSIRRSQGTRKGDQLVLAARVVAGIVITLWAIGLVLFFALRSGDTNDKNNVAIPTQPSVSTTVPPPSTTKPPVTTSPVTTLAPITTAPVSPTTSIAPPPPTNPPTLAPTTVAPTNPPTTAPPTTAPPTTAPPPTTSPDQKQAAIIQEKMLANPSLGPSNRGVPDNQRFVVQYTAGQPIVVTWAINNGAFPLPSGPATCVPPTTTTTLTPPSSTTTSTSTTTTTTTVVPTPTTTLPSGVSTKDQARADAKQILRTLRTRRTDINITDIVLVGTYPMTGNANAEVVRVTYDKAILNAPINFPPATAFQVPPAQTLDCINPAFQ
jgi:hypothetical protein